MEEQKIYSEATHVCLSDTSPLMQPWVKDCLGQKRPPLSKEAMRMSVELAADTYAMDIELWLKAGWRDVTIQVDGELTHGVDAPEGALGRLATAWKLNRIRAKMQQHNPLGQVVGALRQIEKSDTGKALVMCRPTGDGRYIVAISFMGTGTRLYDWFSNFRMASEDGMHQGFLQLTRQFENNEKDITFPQTARELGLKDLTLTQILQEAGSENSRFILWLVGHSQGAAIMQLYCHRKMVNENVLPTNMVGYGFAPPSVAVGNAVPDPAAYPLYHVVNTDDMVPRMGSEVHFGVLLFYYAGEEIRRQCYSWPRDEVSVRNRMAVRPVLTNITGTKGCLETSIAYFQALSKLPAEEVLTTLSSIAEKHPAMQKALAAADNRLDAVLRFVCRHLAAACLSITGSAIDENVVASLEEKISTQITALGLKPFNTALMELMNFPHACVCRDGALMGAYPYITFFGAETLRPMVWRAGRPPKLVNVYDISAWQQRPIINRHRAAPERQNRSTRRYTQQRRTASPAPQGKDDATEHAAAQ